MNTENTKSIRTALILGGTSGIGRGIALAFAAQRMNVYVHGRTPEKGEACVAELMSAGASRGVFIQGDSAESAAAATARARVVSDGSALDILVNNGGGPKFGSFDSLNLEDWRGAADNCLLNYVRFLQVFADHLAASGSGRVVNIVSSSARQALDGLVLSNAFRCAVVGLTKSLAREWGPKGVLVNAVGAGKIDTDRVRDLDRRRALVQGKQETEYLQGAMAQIPLGRYGSPEEFAAVIAFLCSPQNTYLTGQCLLIDGGVTTAY